MKSFFTFVSLAVLSTAISAAPVEKRQEGGASGSGTATFYQPGLGSCGQTDSADAMIVAINSAQGSGNTYCGQQVSITNQQNGQTTTATVQDLCPTCSHGDLDLSPAVFQALGGTEAQGVFPINWSIGGGSSSSSGSSASASASAPASSSTSSGSDSQQSGNGQQQQGQQDQQQQQQQHQGNGQQQQHSKRGSGTATFFQPGLGSCGQTDSADSMIVAINTADVSGNENCGKSVDITNQETGKTVSAKVADLCPTCSSGDLDLSPAVFQALGGTEQQGVFPISWNLN